MLKNLKQFDEFHINEARNHIAVVKKDRYSDEEGRDILVGITIGSNTTFLPAVNTNELITLKTEIENYLTNVK